MEKTTGREYSEATGYGLRREVLSPMETLAQSVSTIAPTTTPVATIPLVCALAGNGTWLAYALATAAVLLVALCISRFAHYSLLARLSLFLRFDDSASLTWRHRCLEPTARLYRHWRERHRRFSIISRIFCCTTPSATAFQPYS